MRLILALLMVLIGARVALGQTSAIDSLARFHEAAAVNSGKIQQEMIYLHLDNTSYYRGDRLYFAGYLVTASRLTPSNLSRTVYVELLNPGGKIIDRCVLKPHVGRFHGSLLVDETPWKSTHTNALAASCSCNSYHLIAKRYNPECAAPFWKATQIQ